MTQISIVIPTFKRPDDLSRLLQSIDQDVHGRDDVMIIVADNDVNETARETVEAFRAATQHPVHYTVAPEPGVSNARNAGMAQVMSRYVLFIDDDMEVVAPYLEPLLEAQAKLGTTITFSPVMAVLPDGRDSWQPWLAPLFSRNLDGPTRLLDETHGTGGCLIDLQNMALPSPVFDPTLNEVGGEDDAFFNALLAQGARAGWCAEATALEHVPPHRATLAYMWRRHFAFGQTPAREAADRGLYGIMDIAKWMAVGGIQTLFHGTAFVAMKALGRPASIGQLGRLAQGVGKIFWWDGLSPRFYGVNAR